MIEKTNRHSEGNLLTLNCGRMTAEPLQSIAFVNIII